MKLWIEICYLLLLIPFLLVLGTVFADSNALVNGVVSAKYFWFYASMGILSPIMLFVKHRLSFRFADLIVLLFVSVQLLVGIASGEPYAKNKLLLLILLYVLYLYVRMMVQWRPNTIQVFSNTLILIALVEGCIGGMQLYGFLASNHGLFRMTGTLFNPGPFGGFMAMLFPLALWRLLPFLRMEKRLRSLLINQGKGWSFRSIPFFKRKAVWISYLVGWVSLLSVVVTVLVLPASMSRASWLGLFAGSFWVMFQFEPVRVRVIRWKEQFHARKWLIVFPVLLFMVGFYLLYVIKPHSANGRFLMWKQAYGTLLDHPFGVGLGKYGAAVAKTQAAYFESGRAMPGEVDRCDVELLT